MATTYYCDLVDDFVDRTGLDATTNKLTGPGGFMAALYGWGSATQLTPGDTLWLEGRAALEKLVKITYDTADTSTWVAGDVVQNHNDGGGASGDDWVGVLVNRDATTIWVQINAASTDIDSVSTADGVDNTTRTETVAGANMTAAEALGIEMMTGVAEGTQADGRINLWGTTDLTDAAANEGLAYLDGNEKAEHAVYVTLDDTDSYWCRYLSFEYATDTGFDTKSTIILFKFWRFEYCRFANNSGSGCYCYLDSQLQFLACIFRDNLSHGMEAAGGDGIAIWCLAEGNGGSGFRQLYFPGTFIQCLSYGNTSDNFLMQRTDTGNILLFECVAVGSTGGSGYFFSGNASMHAGSFVVGCRMINNNQYGIEYNVSGTAESLHLERYNVFYGNLQGDLELTDGLGSDTSYGDDSNHISDPADDGVDADYNVETGKEHRSTAIVLNWDS